MARVRRFSLHVFEYLTNIVYIRIIFQPISLPRYNKNISLDISFSVVDTVKGWRVVIANPIIHSKWCAKHWAKLWNNHIVNSYIKL